MNNKTKVTKQKVEKNSTKAENVPVTEDEIDLLCINAGLVILYYPSPNKSGNIGAAFHGQGLQQGAHYVATGVYLNQLGFLSYRLKGRDHGALCDRFIEVQ